jgi:3-deoxy-manno-octulosonate cytidylyltransferase (CMP-KDO synthetase)
VTLAVIPSRYASTRLPGKPLLDIAGKTLIRRVYEAVSDCQTIDRTVVATDDERIHAHVVDFGGQAVMTSPDHPSGTDRVAEVTAAYAADTLVVNVQGDEPFLQPELITSLLQPLREGQASLATLVTPIDNEQSLFSPNVVKAVCDQQHNALYFSRHAIPYLRGVALGQWIDRGVHLQHLGVYAFTNQILQEVTRLGGGALEQLELLEQLRWLQAGYTIRAVHCQTDSFGIDTPADLEAARRRLGHEPV